jgi:serine/threonine protein kinase, bacterial
MSPAKLPRWSLLVCLFPLLPSCGGGGGGGGATPPPTVPPPPPAATYTVGGNVTGLAGTGLVLRNNNGNDLAVAANGAIAFTTPLPGGSAFSVSVMTQPSSPAQVCVVTGGVGTIAAANVSSIVVTCTTTTYLVNVNVSGLAGSGLVLRNNGANDLPVAANGISGFSTRIASGAAYSVTVGAQPHTPSQTCVVANPAGSVASADVTLTVAPSRDSSAACRCGTGHRRSHSAPMAASRCHPLPIYPPTTSPSTHNRWTTPAR